MAPRFKGQPPRSMPERVAQRRASRQAGLNRRAGKDVVRPRSGGRKVTSKGQMRRMLDRPLSPEVARQRKERTARLENAARAELAAGRIRPADVGASSADAFMARFNAMLQRINYEKYPNDRLRRSRGLRWSWFGEVFEEVIAGLDDLWREIRRFANAERILINDLIVEKGARGLVNGHGKPVPSPAAGGPRAFGKPAVAVDVRLVPRGGKPTDRGLKYTDRTMVSFSGAGADEWAAGLTNVEVKVPKKAWKLGKQSAEAIPRLLDSAYVKYSIIDDTGKVVRDVTIPVERLVINPASTNRVGISANGSGGENWRVIAGRARGNKEVHLRIDVPVGTRGAVAMTKLLFAPSILQGRGR